MSEVTVAQAVHIALDHHRNGRFREAEAIYLQILAVEPNNVDALHFLGVLAHQAGNPQAAIESIERAIALHPGIPEHHINVAGPYRSLNKPTEAIRHLQRALELRPNDPMAHAALAGAYVELGRMDLAAPQWQLLLELEPRVAAHPSNLAVYLERLGKLDEALVMCRRAVQIDPKYPPAYNNLGSVLNKMGRLHEAIAEHERAVELKTDFAEAWINLASAQQESGQIGSALRSARRAAELRPADATAFRILALATEEQGKLDVSAQAYDHAIALLEEKTKAAVAGERNDDVDWLNRLRVLRAIMMPPVYTSMAELEARRAQVSSGMLAMHARGVRLHLEPEPAPVLFQLAYQGGDDRAIAQAYTRLIVPASTGDPPSRQGAGGKIHVAFVSRFFKEHTIGRLNRGLVAQLNRDEFEVTVFSVGDPQDSVARFVKQHADRFVPIAPIVKPAREAIERAAPDILFFTDLGMD
ncbi:MAG: tetratricopeptide repeat protein, partial [Gemmatimonadaceae bacterium]|nr:tetratricopeptide repeat protein [Gemmatimonadaceae bacterium]